MKVVSENDVLFGKKASFQGIEQRQPRAGTLSVIDPRILSRECLIRAIELQDKNSNVMGFCSVEDWKNSTISRSHVDVLLYNIGSAHPTVEAVGRELRETVEKAAPVRVVVISESDEIDVMLAAVDCGARGCIPGSIGIDMLLQAAKLTSAGGVFLPTSSVLLLRAHLKPKPSPAPRPRANQILTSRQAAVAEAMRLGKANKIIAYELNMCENTVKVHVRNIMKKLKATNRTEAAFKLSAMTLEGSV